MVKTLIKAVVPLNIDTDNHWLFYNKITPRMGGPYEYYKCQIRDYIKARLEKTIDSGWIDINQGSVYKYKWKNGCLMVRMYKVDLLFNSASEVMRMRRYSLDRYRDIDRILGRK